MAKKMPLAVIGFLFLVVFSGGVFAGNGCSLKDADCFFGFSNGCDLRDSIVLDGEDYFLNEGIDICADDVVLDCSGSRLIGNGVGTGIALNGFNNIGLVGCEVINYEYGLRGMQSKELSVSNSKFNDNQYGFHFYGLLNSEIISSEFNSNYLSGIYLIESADVSFLQVHANNNFNNLSFPPYNDRGYEKNAGFSSINSERISISSSQLNENKYNGVLLVNSNENIIESNDLIGNGFHGVLALNSDTNTIKNNDLSKTRNDFFNVLGYFGICVSLVDSNDNLIEDNYAFDSDFSCWNNGAKLVNSKSNLLLSNSFTGIWGTAIALMEKSNENLVSDNQANSRNIGGISLSDSHDNQVYRNSANSNPLTGISLVRSNNNLISENIANNNKQSFRGLQNGWGIKVHDSHFNIIEKNELKNNNVNGLKIESSSSGNLIKKNIIQSSGKSGVFFDVASTNQLISNLIVANLNGLELKNTANNQILSNRVCLNQNLDFSISNALNENGDFNMCNKPGMWNDSSATNGGCYDRCASFTKIFDISSL